MRDCAKLQAPRVTSYFTIPHVAALEVKHYGDPAALTRDCLRDTSKSHSTGSHLLHKRIGVAQPSSLMNLEGSLGNVHIIPGLSQCPLSPHG